MFSNAANKSFSASDLQKVLASPEGQRLLTLLRTDGGGALQQAMQAVKRGDYENAKSVLAPMLRDPEAAELLQKLSHGST